jgi:hypothetical protein
MEGEARRLPDRFQPLCMLSLRWREALDSGELRHQGQKRRSCDDESE